MNVKTNGGNGGLFEDTVRGGVGRRGGFVFCTLSLRDWLEKVSGSTLRTTDGGRRGPGMIV